MLAKLRNRITYANVVGTLALFVALGGTSYAAIVVTGKNIKDSTITTKDVKNQSLLAADFKPGQVPQGPQGERGLPGEPGQTGPPGEDGENGLDATAPSGAVMHFDLASCPTGWTELTSARGRYIVGLPVGGTRGAVVGTALSPQEDRPVGRHSHGVTDPGHTHQIQSVVANTASDTDVSSLLNGRGYMEYLGTWFGTRSATTGITVDSAGAVAGTNAPYLQLLVCKKN